MFKIIGASLIKGTHIKARFQVEVGYFRISNIKLCCRDEQYYLLFPQERYKKKSGKICVDRIIDVDKDFKNVLLQKLIEYYLFFTGQSTKSSENL